MNRAQNCCHNFYLHIAKLFYAIAFVDGEVRDEEKAALEETLYREWIYIYKGKRDVVKQIIDCFQQIFIEKPSSEEAFYEFVNYKKQHEKLFTNQMKNTLWEVSCSIADAVNKKNKSELIMLVHLGKNLGLMK